METNWLAVALLALYVAFCASACWRSLAAPNADRLDWMIAGRDLPALPWTLAGLASGYGAFVLLFLPEQIRAGGLGWAPLALGALLAAFAATVFGKRLWILARRWGYVTLGEALEHGYASPALQRVAALIGIAFAVATIAAALSAIVALADALGWSGAWTSAGAAALIALLSLGGMPAIARVDAVHAAAVLAGLLLGFWLAIDAAGGWPATQAGLEALARDDPARVRLDPHLGGPSALWMFSIAVPIAGLATSPSFALWTFASRDVAPFAGEHVWGAGALVGAAAAIGSIGVGAAALVGDEEVALAAAIEHANAPIAAIVSLAALAAAVVSAAAAHAAALAGGRDLARAWLADDLWLRRQRPIAAIAGVLAVLIALAIALSPNPGAFTLFVLGCGFALQLAPALVGLCLERRLRGRGVLWGSIAGVAVYWLLDPTMRPERVIGGAFGPHPLGVHAALWGLSVNVAIAWGLSVLDRSAAPERDAIHDHLALFTVREIETSTAIWAWFFAALWTLFAFGPGAYFGEWLLGDPADIASWAFFVQPLWAYQLVLWAAGCAVLFHFGSTLEHARDFEIGAPAPGERDCAELTRDEAI